MYSVWCFPSRFMCQRYFILLNWNFPTKFTLNPNSWLSFNQFWYFHVETNNSKWSTKAKTVSCLSMLLASMTSYFTSCRYVYNLWLNEALVNTCCWFDCFSPLWCDKLVLFTSLVYVIVHMKGVYLLNCKKQQRFVRPFSMSQFDDHCFFLVVNKKKVGEEQKKKHWRFVNLFITYNWIDFMPAKKFNYVLLIILNDYSINQSLFECSQTTGLWLIQLWITI